MDFNKRKGDLPEQAETDGDLDIRGMLHRDGSVISTVSLDELNNPDALYRALGSKMVVGMPFKDIATSDSIYMPQLPAVDDKVARKVLKRLQDVNVVLIAPLEELQKNPFERSVAVVSLAELAKTGSVQLPEGTSRFAVKCTGLESAETFKTVVSMAAMKEKFTTLIVEVPNHVSRVHASRRVFQILADLECNVPVIHSLAFGDNVVTKDDLILRAGSEAGALLVDGLGDGIMLAHTTPGAFPLDVLKTTSFNLLQGSRMRSTKTDFVSCPSCGRTLFDLQEVTEQIKQKTGHLPGVAIAIMGCIVNGPGEMADADFGYVGGAPGKVDLYVGRDVVKRAIPNEQACDALVQLIKDNGRWVEKPVEEKVDALV
jgi:(E)-4-hydroxy-3-methylbut-2-enyl-diphosphate synthase